MQGLCIDPLARRFCTSLEDQLFRKLLCDKLGQVPLTFFTHVRTSIKCLLVPAQLQPYPCGVYPQHPLPVSDANHTSWIHKRLQWDARWGLNLWHILVNESSQFQVGVVPSYLNITIHAMFY